MERLVYEKMIADYAHELPVEALKKVINLIEFLHDKEVLQKRMETLKSSFGALLKETPNLQA